MLCLETPSFIFISLLDKRAILLILNLAGDF